MKSHVKLPVAIGLALVFAPASITVAATAKAANRPNVLIVLTDDQGYGDFSCHGNPILKTPNLDKLHDQSIRFTDFHVCPDVHAHAIANHDRPRLPHHRRVRGLLRPRFAPPGHPHHGRRLRRRHVPAAAIAPGSSASGTWAATIPSAPRTAASRRRSASAASGLSPRPDYWNNDGYNDWYFHNGKLQQYRATAPTSGSARPCGG